MSGPLTPALLEATGLSVTFPTRDGDVRAVRDLSFTLERGETIGIVGESGSGKSTVALGVLGLLPKYARVTGSVRFMGRELVGLREEEMAKIRSSTIAYIPQDPLTSLNPAFTVGYQVSETIWTRGKASKEEARRRAIELLEIVGIPRAAERADSYPHEFSGGKRQRVVIAIAMANDPDVMIADEPTTALDVTIQAQILEALRAAGATQASLILITHDLGVMAGIAGRVMVMYAGKPVETASADTIFYESRMPYTLGLLGSLPRMDARDPGPLRPIPGSPPSLLNLPSACPFAPRCPIAYQRCLTEEPALTGVDPEHATACHRSAELTPGDIGLFAPTWADTESERSDAALVSTEVSGNGDGTQPAAANGTLIEVHNLVKHFPIRGGKLIRHQIAEAHAVCGVLRPGGRGDPRPGRGVGLRQVDHRANRPPAVARDLGVGSLRDTSSWPEPQTAPADAAASAGGLPGSVRLARPADAGRRDRGGAAAGARALGPQDGPRARRPALRAGGPRPRAPQPLPA